MTLSYQRLSPESAPDILACQTVLEQAPDYYLTIQGKLPDPDAARRDLLEIPPGKSLRDKHSFLIFNPLKPAGVMDIVQGYPSGEIAFIGLLLFTEGNQSKGYGREALNFAKSLARSWNCSHIHISVISTNIRAQSFWQREGFGEIGRKQNHRFLGESVIMEILTTEEAALQPLSTSG